MMTPCVDAGVNKTEYDICAGNEAWTWVNSATQKVRPTAPATLIGCQGLQPCGHGVCMLVRDTM